MSFETTLNKIREYDPCLDGWRTLLKTLNKTQADDEPLNLLTVLNSNGLDDTLWCLRAIEGHDSDIRLFAVWCARQVQHLMQDQRSIDALGVVEMFANAKATEYDLAAARATAWAAARAEARAAEMAAALAAARVEARVAARDVARTAEMAAACGASLAKRATAWAAEGAAAWYAQEARIRQMIADGGFIGSTHQEVK